LEYEAYWLNGERHNPDGPAYKSWYENGQLALEAYWLNNIPLTKKEFERQRSKN